jgi:hypothetical protein
MTMNVNNTIIVLLLSIATNFISAQSSSYISKDNVLKNIVRQGDWDSLIVEGTNLNIEDINFANGYYYVAYGFHKQGDQDKALKYLTKAKARDTSLLGNKITELESWITKSAEIQQLENAALEDDGNGNSLEAAENWFNLWRSDNTRLDAAANGLFILTENKAYQQIITVIEEIRPKVKGQFLTEINNLKTKVEGTPEITKMRKAESETSIADNNFYNSNWQEAYEHYENVGKLNGYNTYISNQMEICRDEIAWKEATNSNYVSDYLNYISNFSNGRHYNSAVQICVDYYYNAAITNARNCELDKAEAEYRNLEQRFPNNATTAQAKTDLCSIYQKCGDYYAAQRTSFYQSTAITYYNKVYRDCYPGTALKLEIDKCEKLAKRWGRPDKVELGYSFDEKESKGFRLATSNTMGPGFHWAMRASKGIFTTTTGYRVNNKGEIIENTGSSAKFSGNKISPRFDGTMGITQRIAYPIYCYLGVGVGYYPELYEMNVYSYSTGALSRTEWSYNEDNSFVKPIAEFGVVLDFAFLHAGLGFVYNGVDDMYKTFALGFAFGN